MTRALPMMMRLLALGTIGIATMCPVSGEDDTEAPEEVEDEEEVSACGEPLATDWFGPYTTIQGLTANLATVAVDGVEREYIIEFPEPYDPSTSYPLVIAFHGNNSRMDNAYGQQLGRAFGFQAIAVYPQGLPGEGLDAIWRLEADGIDVAFFDAIVQHVGEHVCFDRRRVFTWGYSRGGYFANLLACVRGDVIRGNSAAAAGMPLETEDCVGPVSQFMMRGTEDPIVPEIEPRLAREAWLELDGCSEQSTSAFHPDCKLYDDCTSDASVVYCEVPGVGHVLQQDVPGIEEAAVEFLRALE